jgi:hypothetical protein
MQERRPSIPRSSSSRHLSSRLSNDVWLTQQPVANLRQSASVPLGYINPRSPPKVWWDLVMAVLIFYSTLIIPYRIAFVDPAVGGWAIFDWIVDAFFMLDILLNFRTGVPVAALDDDEPSADRPQRVHYSYDAHLIASRYIGGWFALDFASSVPFDRIVELSLAGDVSVADAAWLRSTKLLRTIRLIRLVKLFGLFRLNSVVQKLEEVRCCCCCCC